MRGPRFALAVCCAAVAFAAGRASAQPQLGNQLPNPRLSTVSPAGGKAGTTFELTFTGTDLQEPEALVFSHPGIKAVAIPPEKPKEDPKVKPDPKAPPPQVSKFTVTIAADVPIGYHDVRMVAKHGISNARVFVVGDLPEVAEKEPNNDVDQAQRVELNSTINGTVAQPTDVDYFVFAGKKGQRVLLQCLCASIDSKLTPEIKVLDKNLREMIAVHASPLQDCLVDVTLPEDGDYTIRLVQFAHQIGGPDLFYRLNITTGPWIDAVFPHVIAPGQTADVTVYGRNLPGGTLDPNIVVGGRPLEKLTVKVTAPKEPAAVSRLTFGGNVPPVTAVLDGFEYRLKGPAGSSNGVLMTFARAPVVLEKGDHESVDKAQVIKVPCEVAGRIDKRNDRDFYAFEAKKGDTFVIEVFSHRLGAPTDLFMAVINATGKAPTDMVQLDDNGETLSPVHFPTATRDPAPYKFVAPADGKYVIFLGSHLSSTMADVTHSYTLRIAPEKPDFRLFVMPPDMHRPDSLLVGQGGNEAVTVLVQRLDGFKGEVELTVDGLPPGVTCKPQYVGPGQKQGFVVFSGAMDAKFWAGTIAIKGKGMIDGKAVVHEARPAAVTWPVPPQSGIPTITRLEHNFALAVRDKAPYELKCGIEAATVIHGDKIAIPMKLTRHWAEFKGNLQVILIPQEMPPGVQFAPLTLAPGKDDQTLNLSVPANVAPGKYTFVFKSFAPISPMPKGKAVNVVQPSTAVTLTVLPRTVANLSVSNAAPALKAGDEFELTVKTARTNDYTGEFKVKLVLPPEAKGISAEEVTIPAGQNEVKLKLKAAADAAPGPRNNLTVQATAVLEGVTLTHETKINVTINAK
jgi:hypothetical protein